MNAPNEPGKRQRRELPIKLEPLAVSHNVAAAMLAQIGERTLDALVAEGKIKARQITKGRIGYLMDDLREFVRNAPIVVPGIDGYSDSQ